MEEDLITDQFIAEKLVNSRMLLHKRIRFVWQEIKHLKQDANKGLQVWKEVNELKSFLNDEGFQEIKINLWSSSKKIETLLSNMRLLLQDFKEIVDYDKNVSELISKENKLQDRWKLAHPNVTSLLRQSNIENNNDIATYLE